MPPTPKATNNSNSNSKGNSKSDLDDLQYFSSPVITKPTRLANTPAPVPETSLPRPFSSPAADAGLLRK